MFGSRQHFGLLVKAEQKIISAGIVALPPFVQPDHLTIFAAVGGAVASAALICCWYSKWFLMLFYFGLLAHWFGDSFDGALARLKQKERPKAGFLIDRGVDVFSFTFLILALGYSPFLNLETALFLLVGYLMNSVIGLMRSLVDNRQIIGVGGLGATEGRLIIGVWVAFMAVGDMKLQSLQYEGKQLYIPSGLGMALLLICFGIMALRLRGDIRRHIASETFEAKPKSEHFQNVVDIALAKATRGEIIAVHPVKGLASAREAIPE